MTGNQKIFTSNKSIHQLLRAIFFPYIFAAMAVTAMELTAQYRQEKTYLKQILNESADIYKDNLTHYVHTYDKIALNKFVTSLLKYKHLYGVLIFEDTDELVKAGKTNKNAKTFFHEYPLIHKGKPLGSFRLYSSNSYIHERMKTIIISLLINAAVKTLLLWFIIFYYTRKLLVDPIMAIKDNIEAINFSDLDQLNVFTPQTNEITQLRYSFNEMLDRIQGGREKLVKDIIGTTGEGKGEESPFAHLRDPAYRPIRRTPGQVYVGQYSYLGELSASFALKTQMEALIKALDKYVAPVYEKIKEKDYDKKKILKFANLLINAGHDFKIEDVYRFGSNIKFLLTQKDGERAIFKSLNAYPDYLERLKHSFNRDKNTSNLKLTKVVKRVFPDEFKEELKDIKKEKINIVDDSDNPKKPT